MVAIVAWILLMIPNAMNAYVTMMEQDILLSTMFCVSFFSSKFLFKNIKKLINIAPIHSEILCPDFGHAEIGRPESALQKPPVKIWIFTGAQWNNFEIFFFTKYPVLYSYFDKVLKNFYFSGSKIV